jgi:AraC-like DNA-binding protein
VNRAVSIRGVRLRLLGHPSHEILARMAMGTGSETVQEVIEFRRPLSTPGFHVMDAENSAREWRVVSHLFYIVVFKTWRGHASMAGRTHPAAPGFVLCNRPNELMIGRPQGGLPGSFKVLEFTAELLEEWLDEQPGATLCPKWSGAVQPLEPALSAQFSHFFREFEPGASPLQLQSELLHLSEAIVQHLIAGMPARAARLVGPPIRGTARMRECLHEEGFDIDLETLAQKAGLNRFQALRSFKRRYGLPPHAYQIAVRLGQARRLLCEGSAPVEVALRCGFGDQSHFTRHFKRAYGVTPLHYACGSRRSRDGSLASNSGDPDRIVSRSDHL